MNIVHNVARAATFYPEKTAIIFDGERIRYRYLKGRVNRLAHALQAQGVTPGDRIGIFLPNIPEFIYCYLAAVGVGAIAVSINSMSRAHELEYILNDAKPEILFTTGEFLQHVPEDKCPSLKQVVICEGASQGKPTLRDWIDKGADNDAVVDMHPNDPAVLLYTSGTTGFPKGATLSHGNVVSNAWATVHHAQYGLDDRMLLFLPLFHVFGQNFIMNATFLGCSTLVLQRRFVPDQVMEAISRDRVSMFFAVPTIYIHMLNLNLKPEDLATIRYEFSAAATMPQEISAQWTERFGRPVFEGYGLTECSPFACYNHDFKHKFGSVGTPIENFEIKILDEEDHEVALGEWGEICIRGPGVMSGYWNKPEETVVALRNGWLHSGDIGSVDEQGYVFIVDRVKDMINVSGFKVWPAEVEQFLYRHPSVKEAAVYGAPHPEKGETVRAAIVVKEDMVAKPDDIVSFCRENLAAYKVPGQIEIVSELPKSATGKILKRILRESTKNNA